MQDFIANISYSYSKLSYNILEFRDIKIHDRLSQDRNEVAVENIIHEVQNAFKFKKQNTKGPFENVIIQSRATIVHAAFFLSLYSNFFKVTN